MATRVLNTIREREKIVGFRLICSLKDNKGIHVVSLANAKVFYNSIEHFENVKYVGKGQWEGTECSLDKFPYQDRNGRFVKCNENHFILGKMTYNDEVCGFKVMNLNGDVDYYNVTDSIELGYNEGFVNAKMVMKDGKSIISSIRGNLHTYPVEKLPDKARQLAMSKMGVIPNKQNKDIGKQISLFDKGDSKVMDSTLKTERYKKLAIMFGKKQEGKLTDRDIAQEVGAKTPQEYSQKIHEYLGEDLTVSDNDILKKLYSIYKDLTKVVDKPTAQSNVKQGSSVDKSNPDIKRMQELIDELTPAAIAYYNGEDEIMSNYEYDKKYDELEQLEKKTGVILSGSLTQKVGFEIKSKLDKVKHPTKMLSLDKTKDRQELANSLGGQPGFLGWKLDGLTIVLYYENGELKQAVTRGNGSVGEDITHNAKFCKGVPLKISYTDKLTVRGEALISRKRFEEINAKIVNVDDKYKNARNLAAGSIRQLDSAVAKNRGIEVVAFTVVEGFEDLENYTDKLEELKKYGFDIVPYIKVTKDTTVAAIEKFEEKVESYKYPTDGLVITIDNIAYGEMMGTTSKFPRNAKAFKWKDEASESTMVDIEWSVGRTGAITPVAIFKPVDIDGTTVQRASVHNVSIFKELKLGKGDIVSIIKANMIIPQIVENSTQSANFEIPTVCPVCGMATSIQKSKDAEVLMCTNPDCLARNIGSLSHFVSRDAMNIDGLSEATLEVFVNNGFVKSYKDLYHISDYQKEIINLDGFGTTSYSKLYKAIEKSREVELPAFIYALGIAQMGKSTSKDVCKALDYELENLLNADEDKLKSISGVGDKTAMEIAKYFEANANMVRDLASELTFKEMPKVNNNSAISGKTFCITGDVYTFKNRKELQAKIESLGAKASSSVSSKTDYLINNDITSNSNKNQTAKKLGIPIISEQDFLDMIGE